MYGEKIYHAFQDLKKSFDPKSNESGKIIDTPPMDENLRFVQHTKLKILNISFVRKRRRICTSNWNAMVRQHAKKLKWIYVPIIHGNKERSRFNKRKSKCSKSIFIRKAANQKIEFKKLFDVLICVLNVKLVDLSVHRELIWQK